MSGPRHAAPPVRGEPSMPPWTAELIGTAAMLFIGLSAVVVDFGSGAPIASAVPDAFLRRLITGTVFAGGAAIVVYSILGRIGGRHLNPAVTLAFLRLGKITPRLAAAHVTAQVAGAVLAAVAINLLWGHGRAVSPTASPCRVPTACSPRGWPRRS